MHAHWLCLECSRTPDGELYTLVWIRVAELQDCWCHHKCLTTNTKAANMSFDPSWVGGTTTLLTIRPLVGFSSIVASFPNPHLSSPILTLKYIKKNKMTACSWHCFWQWRSHHPDTMRNCPGSTHGFFLEITEAWITNQAFPWANGFWLGAFVCCTGSMIELVPPLFFFFFEYAR